MNVRYVALVCLASCVVAGSAAGCVGSDPAGSQDAGTTPTGTTTTTTPTPTPTDAAVPPAPDAATPDAQPDAPPPFAPTDLAGLVLWLDPASGVTAAGGKVSAWTDRSRSALTVSQTVAANQPTMGSVGSRPVVAFTNTNWLECASATVGTKLDFAVGDVLAEAVVSLDSANVSLAGMFYKTNFTPSPFDGLQIYANLGGEGKPGAGLDGVTLSLVSPSGNTADGKLHMIGLRRVGNRISLRFDGAEVANSTVTARAVDNTANLYVGGRPDLTHSAAHKIAEILVFKGAVADADLTKVEAFVKQKNGL